MGISLRNVSKTFGDPPVLALQGIDLDVEDGEFIALTGRSGSGKSTLLYLMSSLDVPSTGLVSISGKDVGSMPEKEVHEFRNRHTGFVFQFHYLLPELTCLENVLMPARKGGRMQEREDYAKYLIGRFGLADKHDRLPGQLSGGEQQRVAIARALVMEPTYLFADEPTGNLDSVNGNVVMNIFAEINKEKHMTIIYVTHDQDFAKLARRQVHLADGRIVETKRHRSHA